MIDRLLQRRSRTGRSQSTDGFVEMVDLLVVLLKSGRTTRQSFVCIAEWASNPAANAARDLLQRCDNGARLVDALPALTDHFGATAVSVVNVLAAAERDGLPLAPVLERLVHEAHAERRRRAQTEAAQLPVRLAFPLVVCILPSFVALTVVPIFVGALSSLSLSRV
jgi:type II secretory pathway component PulF